MVATGEHPKVMQSRLGHATPNLTPGLYAHVSDDVDRAATRLMASCSVRWRPELQRPPASAFAGACGSVHHLRSGR